MSDKREQALYFPETMLRELQQHAARLDRSMSWVAQKAWEHACAHIREASYEEISTLRPKGVAMKDNRKQTLFFPEDMLEQIQDEAMRIDSSLSFLVQAAYTYAREMIAAQQPDQR